MSITLTEKAIKEVKRVMEDQKIPAEENVLEVGVVGGGCSGYSYKLGFKKRTDVDALNETVFNFEGLDAVVNNQAMPYITGTTVDFYEGLEKRGFVFDNPVATGGCGCNKSFSV